MKTILLIIMTTVLFNNIMAQVSDSVKTKLDSLKSEIESNYYTANTGFYQDILESMKSIKNNSKESWRKYYYSGFVSLQLGKIFREQNSSQASNYFEQAAMDLKRANKENKQAEILALLSSTYGKLTSISIFKAIGYGNESEAYMTEARVLADSAVAAKLNLVEAIHLMFTPAIFGGDKKRAEDLLLDALDTGTNNNSLFLNWADQAEIYAYLAQLEFEKENYIMAGSYCQKALQIESSYRFILNELQPEINKYLGE